MIDVFRIGHLRSSLFCRVEGVFSVHLHFTIPTRVFPSVFSLVCSLVFKEKRQELYGII